ncbi:diaminopimelate epimerase [Robertkochia aurantiaca]|uniref:diaminopimelate epimerase n=1 Tax=Robertkochia aurantiaca TaxID=2873700 RepID=UPI001CCFB257|nr:diaminopimelate epimerase [Robertkochia sp. 3YJGBD-33]
MEIKFYKYQGTGNDFVVIDNRRNNFPKNNTKLISGLCNRRFGIGADGLILLEESSQADFCMVYYNADGRQSSMCGNGGRCIVAFAADLGLVGKSCSFMAVDGLHEAKIAADGTVSLKMIDVDTVDVFEHYSFLDTGSPHHVQEVNDLHTFDVNKEGSRLRYGKYGKKGSNINFVSEVDTDIFAVRTYERGVENETYSCGTGVTAVALAMHRKGKTSSERIILRTEGGELAVSFMPQDDTYTDIWLSGPAVQVFEGRMTIEG